MKKLIYKIKVREKEFDFNQLEFLIFSSFILRLKKECDWNDIKNKPFFISSNNYTLLKAMVDRDCINLVILSDTFCLTSSEFFSLYENMLTLLNTYFPIEGLDYSTLDGVFFEHMLAIDLPFLRLVKDELISIDSLSIFSINKKVISIQDSEHYNMVAKGYFPEIKTRTNLHNQTHEERFELIKEQLLSHPYGTTGENIVVYNNDNIIRDGAHRAAILYANDNTQLINVKRYLFSSNYFSFSGYYKSNQPRLYFSSFLSGTKNSRWIYINCKKSTILRSDAILENNIEDINRLKKYDINTIIDLRAFGDRKKPQFLINNFDYHNVPIVHTNKATKEETALFVKNASDYYLFLLSQTEKIKNVFDIIMNAKNNILIFCMAGRDRTGVISILCELLLGASIEEIVEEYALTDAIYERLDDDKFKDYSCEKAKKNIEEFLNLFFDKFDNISNFFNYLGYSQEEIDIICAKVKGL